MGRSAGKELAGACQQLEAEIEQDQQGSAAKGDQLEAPLDEMADRRAMAAQQEGEGEEAGAAGESGGGAGRKSAPLERRSLALRVSTGGGPGFQSAVITEEKPPRAFQSATMVRRRGLRHLPRSSQILFVAASKKMPSLRNEWK